MPGERGEYRSIYVVLPDDADFQRLSADARAVFYPLKLLLGLAGIGVFYAETLPRRTGLPLARTDAALAELEAAGWIAREGNVVWIRNGLRWEPSDPLASENGRKGILRHLRTLPKLGIVREFARYYGLPDPFPALSEAPAEPVPTPCEGGPEGVGGGTGEPKPKPEPEPKPKPKPETESSAPRGGAARRRRLDATVDGDGKPPPTPSWSSRACDAWIEVMGGTAPGGRIGKALKPLVEKYGEEEVLTYWRRYLERRVAEGDIEFATPETFATRYGAYKDGLGRRRGGGGPREYEYGEGTTEVPEWRD